MVNPQIDIKVKKIMVKWKLVCILYTSELRERIHEDEREAAKGTHYLLYFLLMELVKHVSPKPQGVKMAIFKRKGGKML